MNHDPNFIMDIIPASITKGDTLKIRFFDKSERQEGEDFKNYVVRIDQIENEVRPQKERQEAGDLYDFAINTSQLEYGGYAIDVCLKGGTLESPSYEMRASGSLTVKNPLEDIGQATTRIANTADEGISLKSTTYDRTPDLPLWVSILRSTEQMDFANYKRFMDLVFCGTPVDAATQALPIDEISNLDQKNRNFHNQLQGLSQRRFLPFTDTDSYRVLQIATEAFVMVNCEVNLGFDANGNSVELFPESEIKAYIEQRGFNISGIDNENRPFQEIWNNYLPALNGSRTLPYLFLIRQKLGDLPLKKLTIEQIIQNISAFNVNENSNSLAQIQDICTGLIADRLTRPCFLELIWSYWHEESMMVQGMKAISRRFQNIRGNGPLDPLANMEIDPLQPLNSLIWGYIQNEQHRLTVSRRAYEYDHHYGFSIKGKAIQNFRPANSRTRFIEAFHQLLYLCAQFYKQEDNTTIKADAFPIRNALRELHLILAEGAHNQYGDLPSTARIEMLMQQYLLARPEFRQFIPSSNMVANPEPWMDRVASINKLMGWTDLSPIHFHNLAVFGEQLLLSIRFGAWADTSILANQAAVWANFWRQAVQEYIHAYHGVTGVDLAAERTNGQRIDSRPPSEHLARKLAAKANGKGSSNGHAVKASSNGHARVHP